MSNKSENLESTISWEDKAFLESEIPPAQPLILPDKKFLVRLLFVPVVIALFVYFNFFGKPVFLQDTTWVIIRYNQNNDLYCMLWDFDKSGDLLIVTFDDDEDDNNVEDKEAKVSETYTAYKLVGSSRIKLKRDSGWLKWYGNYLNIDKQEDGSFIFSLEGLCFHGYPNKERYPKNGSMNKKYQYFINSQAEHMPENALE